MSLTNSDWIAIFSAVVATAALCATYWQARQTRQHNKLSVKPHLVWHTDRIVNSDSVEIKAYVRNNGIGPALITDWTLTLDGVPYKKPPATLIPTLVEELIGSVVRARVKHNGTPGINTSMPANAEIVFAHLVFPTLHKETEASISAAFERVDLIIHYESFYGDKFTMNTADPE